MKKYYCPKCSELKGIFQVKKCVWHDCKWCHKPVITLKQALEMTFTKTVK